MATLVLGAAASGLTAGMSPLLGGFIRSVIGVAAGAIDSRFIYPALLGSEGDRTQQYGSIQGMIADEGEAWPVCLGPKNRVRGTLVLMGNPVSQTIRGDGKRGEPTQTKWSADMAVAFGMEAVRDGGAANWPNPTRFPSGIEQILADGKQIYDSRAEISETYSWGVDLVYDKNSQYRPVGFTNRVDPTSWKMLVTTPPETQFQQTIAIVSVSAGARVRFTLAQNLPTNVAVGSLIFGRLNNVTGGLIDFAPWQGLRVYSGNAVDAPGISVSAGAPYVLNPGATLTFWTPDAGRPQNGKSLLQFYGNKPVTLRATVPGGPTLNSYTLLLESKEQLGGGRSRAQLRMSDDIDNMPGTPPQWTIGSVPIAAPATGSRRVWKSGTTSAAYLWLSPNLDIELAQEPPLWTPSTLVNFSTTTFPFYDAYRAGSTDGVATQVPPSDFENVAGSQYACGYRRRAWAWLADFNMGSWGDRPPNFEAIQVERDALTVGDALRSICSFYGLDTVGTSSRLNTTESDGYTRSGLIEGTQALQPLMLSHDVIARELENWIDFRTRQDAIGVANVILPEQLGASVDEIGGERYRIRRQQEVQIPRRLGVKYRDPDANYDWGVESLVTSQFTDGAERMFTIPEAMSSDRAKEIALRLLTRMQNEVDTFSTVLGPEWTGLHEGEAVWVLKEGPDGTDWLPRDYLILVITVEIGANNLVAVTGTVLDEPSLTPPARPRRYL